MAATEGADTRTMPTAPRPGAVAMAAMGWSWRGSMAVLSNYKGQGPLQRPLLSPWRSRYLNFGRLNSGGTPMRVLISHCCAIDSTLFVIQYSTRPDGKKKNITENASGMNHISLACIGSGGVGFSAVCSKVVSVITSGRMKNGSGAARSLIQPTQGAPRISTLDSSTQYRAMNTGICTMIGRQPPMGLTFSSR